jgi:hypothetical protein
MKKTVFAIPLAASSLLWFSCGPTSPAQHGANAEIYFERIGGGEKQFTVATNETSGGLVFSVSHLNYKDTLFAFTADVYADGALYDSVAAVLNGSALVQGSFKESPATSGTWARMSAISLRNDTVEITNVALRNELLLLEGFVNSSAAASKRLVIEHVQTVSSQCVRDSSKSCVYAIPCILPMPPQVADRIHDSARTEFINKISTDAKAVAFVDCGINIFMVGDLGGAQHAFDVENAPFTYKTTKYNARDSAVITVSNIAPTGSSSMSCNGNQFTIAPLDSISFTDTLYARPDSTWCYQKIIITHTFINHGYDNILKPKYSYYFW